MRVHIIRLRLLPVLALLVALVLALGSPSAEAQRRPLERPDQVTVERLDDATVVVRWRDRSSDETHFVVQRRGPDTVDWLTVATPPINREETVVPVGVGNPSTFRVRAERDIGQRVSAWSENVSFTPLVLPLAPCVNGGRDLCLHSNRFRVRVDWRVPKTDAFGRGVARRFTFSDDAGIFWFFEPANLELAVKILDATALNGFYWVLHGGLTHVEYWITVTDTLAQSSQTFHKFPGTLCGGASSEAFPVDGLPPSPPIPPGGVTSPNLTGVADALTSGSLTDELPHGLQGLHAAPLGVPEDSENLLQDPLVPSADTGVACVPSDTALCLQDGRFRVGVQWFDPRSGNSGAGQTQIGTNDSGFFWFFNPDNVELVTKVIDGRSVNGRFWFFYGGLSDVQYTIQVTDLASNTTRVYINPAFNICGEADTSAF